MKLNVTLLSGILIIGLLASVAIGVPGVARDFTKPRVPAGEIQKARATKPPFDLTSADVIAKGKAIFLAKGKCFVCHGKGGKGDGVAAADLDPSPPDFTNPRFAKLRTPGEMMWILKNGSPGTAMASVVSTLISEEEGWQAIAFERSLGGH
ncbi:MAG: c-type cytochrome [Nitrospiria bacterium]